MKVKKAEILSRMQVVYDKILWRLLEPALYYGPTWSNTEDVKAFQEAKLMAIVSQVLAQIREDSLDKNTWNTVVNDVISAFKSTKASKVDVHYKEDWFSKCDQYLLGEMKEIWDEIWNSKASNRILKLMESLEESLNCVETAKDYQKEFAEIVRIWNENAAQLGELEHAELTNIQVQFRALKLKYLQLMAERVSNVIRLQLGDIAVALPAKESKNVQEGFYLPPANRMEELRTELTRLDVQPSSEASAPAVTPLRDLQLANTPLQGNDNNLPAADVVAAPQRRGRQGREQRCILS